MAATPKIKLPKQLSGVIAALKPVLRHHYFIVTIILFGSVGFGVYTVNQTLATPDDDAYRLEQLQNTLSSKFNKSAKDTIEKIRTLKRSTDAASAQEPFPTGRINPFAE